MKEEAKRVPVRTPGNVPDGELDGLDEQDIAELDGANEGKYSVPDNELSPELLAYAKKWRKQHGH